MKREEGTVLQPYGKDDVSVNFIVTPFGKWVFGPSDVDKVEVFKKNAHIFNFVRFQAKNPKYYVRSIDKDFKIKEVDTTLKAKLTHDTTDSKSIFFFMFYEPREDFVAMNYTTKESEFDFVDKHMNVLSVVSFYGKNFNILEENWDHGITVNKNQIHAIVEKLKNEASAT